MQITVHSSTGVAQTLDAEVGVNLMELLRDNGVTGVEAECGGCLTCGTCSVEIHADWFTRLSPVEEAEGEMLEYGLNPGPHMRLACQIVLSSDCDGLELVVPAAQR